MYDELGLPELLLTMTYRLSGVRSAIPQGSIPQASLDQVYRDLQQSIEIARKNRARVQAVHRLATEADRSGDPYISVKSLREALNITGEAREMPDPDTLKDMIEDLNWTQITQTLRSAIRSQLETSTEEV